MKFDSLWTQSPVQVPITFPKAGGGRSMEPNNPLTRLRGFTVGGSGRVKGRFYLEPRNQTTLLAQPNVPFGSRSPLWELTVALRSTLS